MTDATTNRSDEYTQRLYDEYPDIAGPGVCTAEDIATGQKDGRTLFAHDDEELYGTGKRARETYRELTTMLLERTGAI